MDMGCCEEGSGNRNTTGDPSEGRVGRRVGGLERERVRDPSEEHVPSFSLKEHVCVCVCFY